MNNGTAVPPDPGATLNQLALALRASRALHAAAVLDIASLLADGPRDSASLATATGTHPGALRRLMRALSAFGVFAEPAPGIFAPTPVSDRLRDGAPDSIFVAAYNFARRLKTLRGLTPYEAICRAWTDEPSRFIHDPHHQISGPNI